MGLVVDLFAGGGCASEGIRMTHTPGPWEISLREMLDGWVIVVDDNEGIVANVNTESGPDIPPLVSRKMPAGANAALIAAAPQMFSMLLELHLRRRSRRVASAEASGVQHGAHMPGSGTLQADHGDDFRAAGEG